MSAPRPYTLVAEVTYRCPLRCVYCSNPLELAKYRDELDTETWLRVIREAEELGVVQMSFSGGEPLVRADLETLIAEARRLDLYTNLATSAVPLPKERLQRLKDAGLDNIQISIQDVVPEESNRIAGLASFERKIEAAKAAKAIGFPLTLNVVLHRQNLDRVEEIITLAESLEANRLELANTQYLAWALLNRSALLPSRDQLKRAREVAVAARDRLKERMEILFVLPDYYGKQPKACMDGWASRFLLVSPDGKVVPCHAAHTIPGLRFENVKEKSLAEIWSESPALGAFRGNEWMKEPCRSCDRRDIDFGGCRCQAFALTGDAAAADPVCSLSSAHGIVLAARAAAEQPAEEELVYRSQSEPPPAAAR